MEWLAQNWVWVLVFAAFIWMHLFGHGGYSCHGGHDGGDAQRPTDGEQSGKDRPQGHYH